MSRPLKRIVPEPQQDQSAEIVAYATEVFGDERAATEWLDTPLAELDELSPSEWLSNKGDAGLQDVKNVLVRIEYGVYS